MAPILDEETSLEVATPKWGEGRPWGQRADEPAEAYDGFFFFRSLFPNERNIKSAWLHALAIRDPDRLASIKSARRNAPEEWLGWAILYDWDTRAAAFDDDFRSILAGSEEDALKEMVVRHQTQLTTLQVLGMAHIVDEGFDSSATALRAVLHSMEMEQKMAGIPDVSEFLIMDAAAFKDKFANLLQLLAMAKG